MPVDATNDVFGISAAAGFKVVGANDGKRGTINALILAAEVASTLARAGTLKVFDASCKALVKLPVAIAFVSNKMS